MNSKALLIAAAAFALTATGTYAFNEEVLKDAGLTEEQISAFEEAHELKKNGDRDAARNVLEEAGIDFATLASIREQVHAERHVHRQAIHDAVENNDYVAFKEAVVNTPLADVITSESDFALFVEAHNYKEAGDMESAKAIFDELGIKKPTHGHGHRHGAKLGHVRGEN